jgi:predicted ester cyclase
LLVQSGEVRVAAQKEVPAASTRSSCSASARRWRCSPTGSRCSCCSFHGEISHLRDGRIVEDWSGFDSLELLRQFGVLRTLLAAPHLLGAMRDARRS